MNIDIKKSTKPVKYIDAIEILEKRVIDVSLKKKNELIWILEHPSIFTAGKRYIESEIIDKKIKLVKTKRGGKITWHGKGQLICYFVIDLSKRNKDIRKFVNLIEKVIIESLKKYNIYSFSDRKNVGIWTKDDNKIKTIIKVNSGDVLLITANHTVHPSPVGGLIGGLTSRYIFNLDVTKTINPVMHKTPVVMSK